MAWSDATGAVGGMPTSGMDWVLDLVGDALERRAIAAGLLAAVPGDWTTGVRQQTVAAVGGRSRLAQAILDADADLPTRLVERVEVQLLTPLATRSRARPPTAPTTALELTMCCTDPDRSLRHAVAVAAGEASPEDPDPADGMTVQAFLDACEARAHRPDGVLLIRGHLRSESRAFHVADFGIAFSDGVLPARFLERHLGVKVLTLNSFGQVSQVIREMLEVGQLDTAQAHSYFNVGSRKGGRYGHRFNRLMRSVYTAIGSPSGTVTPATLDLMRGRLHREIGRTVLPCLGRELRPFADREVRDGRGDPLEQTRYEHFNLVLWLRTLPADKMALPEYALQTVGCSAFAHTETWSYHNHQHISPASGYPAVEAVYKDEAQLVDLAGSAIPLWPTLCAVPVLANDDWDSDLCIGAITLGSHSLIDPELHEANESVHRRSLSVLRILKAN